MDHHNPDTEIEGPESLVLAIDPASGVVASDPAPITITLLDTPYGKIPMMPNSIENRDDETVSLRAWDGQVWKEPNPREDD